MIRCHSGRICPKSGTHGHYDTPDGCHHPCDHNRAYSPHCVRYTPLHPSRAPRVAACRYAWCVQPWGAARARLAAPWWAVCGAVGAVSGAVRGALVGVSGHTRVTLGSWSGRTRFGFGSHSGLGRARTREHSGQLRSKRARPCGRSPWHYLRHFPDISPTPSAAFPQQ